MQDEINNKYKIVEMQPQIGACFEDLSTEGKTILKWAIISIMYWVTDRV